MLEKGRGVKTSPLSFFYPNQLYDFVKSHLGQEWEAFPPTPDSKIWFPCISMFA